MVVRSPQCCDRSGAELCCQAVHEFGLRGVAAVVGEREQVFGKLQ